MQQTPDNTLLYQIALRPLPKRSTFTSIIKQKTTGTSHLSLTINLHNRECLVPPSDASIADAKVQLLRICGLSCLYSAIQPLCTFFLLSKLTETHRTYLAMSIFRLIRSDTFPPTNIVQRPTSKALT